MSQLLNAIAALKNVSQLPPGFTINVNTGHRDVIYVDDIDASSDYERLEKAVKIANENDAREIRLSGRQYNLLENWFPKTDILITGTGIKTLLKFHKGGLQLLDREHGDSIYVHYNQKLRDLRVGGNHSIYNAPNRDEHGIYITSKVNLQNVSVSNFGGNGFHISSNLPNNSSAAIFRDCSVTECGSIGFYDEGGDANSMLVENIDVRDCAIGIKGRNFLGNLYLKPMIHNCHFGSIIMAEANQENLVLHPYVEEDSPPMVITGRNLSIGGQSRATEDSNHISGVGGVRVNNNLTVGSKHGVHTSLTKEGLEFLFWSNASGLEIVQDHEARQIVIRDRWTKEVKQEIKFK